MQHIDTARQRGISFQQYISDEQLDKISVDDMEDIAARYRDFKTINNICDYTDMLYMARNNDIEIPELDYLFVDEAQDMNPLMWEILNKLASNSKHIIIAGDDKQCINEYSAADVNTFLSLPGKVEVLEQSHRVPRKVFKLANSVVKHMHKYRPEGAVWKPREEEGEVRYGQTFPTLAVASSKGSVLVLTRAKFQCQEFADALLRLSDQASVLFTVHGEPPVDMDIFRMMALFKDAKQNAYSLSKYVVFDKKDSATQRKSKCDYIRMFKKFISCDSSEELDKWEITDAFIKKLELPWYQAMDKVPGHVIKYCRRLWPYYERKGTALFKDARIKMMTIHASKGREADNVFLFTDVPRSTRETIAYSDSDSEAKIAYVAVTRAKSKLYIFGKMQKKFSLMAYL